MQVADDDSAVARESLASFREMLCAPSLAERDVCREQLVEGISQGRGCRGAARWLLGRSVRLDGLPDGCRASGRSVALSNLGATTREETPWLLEL
jgi:hypothetical protein